MVVSSSQALTALLDAGQAEGSIRPDGGARDVISLTGYLTQFEQAEWEAGAPAPAVDRPGRTAPATDCAKATRPGTDRTHRKHGFRTHGFTASQVPVTRLVPVAPLSGRTGQARLRPGQDQARCPDSQEAWARSGAWPPRAQTGKGEIALGPSMKIMPVDSYSTLGRSCEPAFKWILLGAGLRGGVRRSLSAGPRRAATRRAARSPGPEAHPRSSRPYPGPDPLTGGRGRGIPARPEAPNSGIHRCLPAVIRSA